jgi:hypothetical protein
MAEVGEQKVDVWQGASETITKLDAENHEADVIRDDPETQTDLDQMLSSEVQDTRKESGISGDDKPTHDGKVGTLYASFCISLRMLCFSFHKLHGWIVLQKVVSQFPKV